MVILVILAIMIIAGICLINFYYLDFLGILLAVIGGVGLMIALMALPINRMEIKAKIKELEMTRETITQARNNGNELEKAAIQHKIVEFNQWLANTKYWNETVFDIWIPDEIMQLKPLR